MRPEEVDAASDEEVRRLLETLTAARLQVEAEDAAADQRRADRQHLTDELVLGADAAFVAGARAAAEAGATATRRTAAEYTAWSDERIAMLRRDPEEQLSVLTEIPLEGLGITVPIPDGSLHGDDGFDEPSPLPRPPPDPSPSGWADPDVPDELAVPC